MKIISMNKVTLMKTKLNLNDFFHIVINLKMNKKQLTNTVVKSGILCQ